MPKSATISGVQFERFIQSSFRIKSADTVIYVDPHRITSGDTADLVLITHEHYDHIGRVIHQGCRGRRYRHRR